MDNLIHASATVSEAEREVKLWFKPNEIPTAMHACPSEKCGEYYYYKDNKLYMKREPGTVCFLVPDDIGWKSDLETLRQLSRGEAASCSLEAVVAKYLINHEG